MPMYEILMSSLAQGCCYLELLDQLQKQIYRTVGPPLAASLEPLVHCHCVASLKAHSKIETILPTESPFKMIKNAFYFI